MKIIFLDNSQVVLETLRMLMKNFDSTIETHFYSQTKEIEKRIESQTLEFDILFSELIFYDTVGIALITAIKEHPKYKDKKVSIITKYIMRQKAV